VVPLTRKEDWEAAKYFSHAIVKYMAKLIPDRFSAVSGPKNRVEKIFIVYLRNGKGATSINAHAVRARGDCRCPSRSSRRRSKTSKVPTFGTSTTFMSGWPAWG